MGKGDSRTKRGKIFKGSFGKTRPRKRPNPKPEPAPAPEK
jgi:ribosomal small subunit protein bTHX